MSKSVRSGSAGRPDHFPINFIRLLSVVSLVLATSVQNGWAAGDQGTNPLSRRQAVDEALARNPALAAARARVEQARADVVVAGAFADASVFVDTPGQRRILDPRSGTGGDQGIGVTLPLPGTRGLRREVAAGTLRAAEFDLDQLRQQTASQAVQAYDAVLVTLRHRAVFTRL